MRFFIIDHYVNDSFFYKDKLGDDYEYYLDIFYNLLSALNVQIVNVMFPIIGKINESVRWTVRGFCERFSISFIDMNELPFRSEHFRDNLHIGRLSSYMLGVFLLSGIAGSDKVRPVGGKVNTLPIRVLTAAQMSPDLEVLQFSNRTCSIDYVKLERQVNVPLLDGEQVASIGYFRGLEALGHHGFLFNDIEIAVNPHDYGFFHELVDETESSCFQIGPVVGDRVDVAILAGRGAVSGEFVAPNLVSLLCVDRSTVLNVKPAARTVIEFDLARLVTSIDSVQTKCMPALSYKAVDKIRDLALAWEDKDLNLAAELMDLAFHYRPTGPFIKKKAVEYAGLVAKNKK